MARYWAHYNTDNLIVDGPTGSWGIVTPDHWTDVHVQTHQGGGDWEEMPDPYSGAMRTATTIDRNYAGKTWGRDPRWTEMFAPPYDPDRDQPDSEAPYEEGELAFDWVTSKEIHERKGDGSWGNEPRSEEAKGRGKGRKR